MTFLLYSPTPENDKAKQNNKKTQICDDFSEKESESIRTLYLYLTGSSLRCFYTLFGVRLEQDRIEWTHLSIKCDKS